MKFLALIASTSAVASAAAIAPISARQDFEVVFPSHIIRRFIESGELVEEKPLAHSVVVKNGNAADEVSAITTFDFDESTKGKKCQLHFELQEGRDTSDGSERMDIFIYKNLPGGAAPTKKTVSVKERDEHVGRIHAPLGEAGDDATWEQAYEGWPEIDCPAGETLGLEFVGVGDEINVKWTETKTGPSFRVLN